MYTSISIFTEIPEQLHASLQQYLETHPTWDQDQVFAAALSLFLMRQESPSQDKPSPLYHTCAQFYLESVWQRQT
jgi:hypothetical protein